MDCPICDHDMKKVRWDISHNFEAKKEYDRTVYVCKVDDVWVTTEIPCESQSNKDSAE